MTKGKSETPPPAPITTQVIYNKANKLSKKSRPHRHEEWNIEILNQALKEAILKELKTT